MSEVSSEEEVEFWDEEFWDVDESAGAKVTLAPFLESLPAAVVMLDFRTDGDSGSVTSEEDGEI